MKHKIYSLLLSDINKINNINQQDISYIKVANKIEKYYRKAINSNLVGPNTLFIRFNRPLTVEEINYYKI